MTLRDGIEKTVMVFMAITAVTLSAAFLIGAVTSLIWVTRDANAVVLVGIAVMTVALAVLVAVVWFTVEGRRYMRQLEGHCGDLESAMAGKTVAITSRLERIARVVDAVDSVARALEAATPQDLGTAQGIFK